MSEVKPNYQLVKWNGTDWDEIASDKRHVIDGMARKLSREDGQVYGIRGWQVLEQPSDKPFAMFYLGEYFARF